MDDEKKLWFMCALSLKTTKPEIAEKIAEEIVKRIETEEEYEFVKKLIEKL